jgi:peptide/nickel transport system permease protein
MEILMKQYIIRRLLSIIPVLLLVTIISFSLTLLTGDPVKAILGSESDLATIERTRQQLGLDQPIYIQYFKWLGRVFQGDLGYSFRNKQPVLEAIIQRLPVTIWLNVISFTITILLGIPAGLISAIKRNTPVDFGISVVSLVGVTMPNFFLAIILIYIFSIGLNWLPPSGYINPLQDPIGGFKSLLMPAITLGTAEAAAIARMTRSSAQQVLCKPYMVTAKAKGLSQKLIVSRHLVKNSLIPVTTTLGMQIGISFGGAVVTETIFSLPGLGRLVVNSILARDFPIVQGTIIVISLAFLLSNLLVDILYAYLDPRIRYC